MLVDTAAGRSAGLSDEEKTAIQEQLARLLADSHFSQSRRFPSFLRYVVEKTLAGQDDALKERTLGVEIFGRRPDYDTASDPIVRVTAAEIRKRIAQYYQDPGHESELRVSLPLVPTFLSSTGRRRPSKTVVRTQRSFLSRLPWFSIKP